MAASQTGELEANSAMARAVETFVTAAVERLSTDQHAGFRGPKPTQPEEYSGNRAELRKWVKKAKLWLAEYPRMSEDQKARRLGGRLTGTAEEVYFTLLDTVEPTQLTPDLIFDTLHDHFGNAHEKQDALAEWDALDQGSMTVVEFANTIKRVATTPGLEVIRQSETLMLHRLHSGLASKIKRELILQDFDTFDSCLKAALKVEQALNHRKTASAAALQSQRPAKPQPAPQQGRQGPGQRRQDGRNVQSNRRDWRPQRTGGQPQRRDDRPRPGGQPPRREDRPSPVKGTDGNLHLDVTCYECKRVGHFKALCPLVANAAGNPHAR